MIVMLQVLKWRRLTTVYDQSEEKVELVSLCCMTSLQEADIAQLGDLLKEKESKLRKAKGSSEANVAQHIACHDMSCHFYSYSLVS